MYTSHKQELIKGVYTDIFSKGIRVLNSQIGVILIFFVNLFWPLSLLEGGRRHIYTHIHTWFAQVLAIIMLGWLLIFIF